MARSQKTKPKIRLKGCSEQKEEMMAIQYLVAMGSGMKTVISPAKSVKLMALKKLGYHIAISVLSRKCRYSQYTSIVFLHSSTFLLTERY